MSVREAMSWGALGVLASLCACVTTQSESSDPPERWEIEILRGAHHIGTQEVTNWPPPLGECIDRSFTVEDLPNPDAGASPDEVLLYFAHAGEAQGSIVINGQQVFERVDFIDRIASAIVDVTVCAITEALPGDAECDSANATIEVTTITRRFPSELLVVGGANSVQVCAMSGDFLLADGLRILEASPRSEQDAGAD